MTQKHFIAIAAIIKRRMDNAWQQPSPDAAQHVAQIALLAREMADYFQTVNANFDRSRFLRACGVQS